MAFDAGMLRCVLREVEEKLSGGKIEKIYMPQRDMVLLQMKNGRDVYRLLINAGASSPRLCITAEKAENPAVPPMFCMALRKHLGGAKLIRIAQFGFERAARFTFEAYDEMGFKTEKHLIAEIMGKYSNLILCDRDDKMIGILKPVDFTTSQKRQLLPGMRSEEPPKQDKLDPMTVTEREFNDIMGGSDPTAVTEKKLTATFAGMASVTAREIAFRAGGHTAATLEECSRSLWQEFSAYRDAVRGKCSVPTLILSPQGAPKEYSYTDILQYGDAVKRVPMESFSALIDAYFAQRSRQDVLQQKASDILRLLHNAENRIEKKLAVQTAELTECDSGDTYKLYGDLITANIYRLKKGMKAAALENYYAEDAACVEIPLEINLTPAQNAQKYYKKKNKTKSARIHLTEQIEQAKAELSYIHTVQDALSRAETEKDLSEIRLELYQSGYASKMKNFTYKKPPAPTLLRFVTDDGRQVLCGKNNVANDYLTTKVAQRSDWWFHVKNQPGSHVVLSSDGEADEPTDRDFTQAAMIAAYYSKVSDGVMVPVDYTRVRYVKKPSGAKPGFVTYSTNWTAYVTPEKDTVERMKVQ